VNVKLVAISKPVGDIAHISPQDLCAYVARVSNPSNQMNTATAPKLLKYCVDHGHHSVFEHSYMTLEIQTTRAIAAQILRHRSFVFQEFSQRYATATEYEVCEARRQDTKNRQNSISDMSPEDSLWFKVAQESIWKLSYKMYEIALKKNIARECARFLLPLNTKTTLYMTGNARSWMHYIQLRSANGTQVEHADIAKECKKHFVQNYPDVGAALGWTNEAS
jgi:thymidylate synthase (FAD)